MKYVNLGLTYLVAVLFVVLGAGNYFFHFMPEPPPPTPDAGTFASLLVASHYMLVVKILELIGGALLLYKGTRALGWAVLLPIIVNIVLFEVCLAKLPGIGIALLLINLYMIVFVHRKNFSGIIKE